MAGDSETNGVQAGDKREDPSQNPTDDAPQEKRQKTQDAPPGVKEEGQIYFLYRPRVGFTEAKSLAEVQRFYFILKPDNSNKKRLVVIGKKKIPDRKERFFGFVEAVSEKMEELTGDMGPQERETKTAGVRRTESTRIAGEGKYSISENDGSRTYLAWTLEVPADPGQVQKDLCISKDGSLSISIKNPKKPNPGQANIGLDTKADFGEKQKQFDGTPGGYAWIAAKDPSLLDHVNAEILLIGAGDNLKENVGEDVEKHLKEKAAEHIREEAHADPENAEQEQEEAKLVEELKKELKADENKLEEAPVKEQEWK